LKRSEAIRQRYDYEGTFHGIPIYFKEEGHLVAGKNLLCDILVLVATYMDLLAQVIVGGGTFNFKVYPLEREDEDGRPLDGG